MEDKLRNDFEKLSKDFRTQKEMSGKVFSLSSKPFEKFTATDGVAMIFAFMKVLDPTSVVREGEQATAANARGIPAATRTFYNRLLTGQKLDKEQISNFSETTRNLLAGGETVNSEREQKFRSIAERRDLNADNVILPEPEKKKGKQKVGRFTIETVE
jgi:hypothetical protein